MTDISVTTNDGRIEVRTPYNPDFPSPARGLGGKWNGSSKVWTFDVRDEDRVRALVRETYGTDGDDGTTTVNLRIRADLYADDDSLWVAGRQIARRLSRDYTVRLGENCVIIGGGFPGSGGSHKNPRLDAEDGTIIEIRDVPAALALGETTDADAAWIVGNEETDDKAKKRAKLEARKAELLAELAKVETDLQNLTSGPPTKYDRIAADES